MPKYEVRSNKGDERPYPYTTSDHFLEIMEGLFVGLHFSFGQIEFAGEDENGNGKINFDYNLLYIPEHINLDESKPDVEQMIGTILQHVLETMVTNDETGTSDTESTAEGRGLSQEGDSISEG